MYMKRQIKYNNKPNFSQKLKIIFKQQLYYNICFLLQNCRTMI